MSTSDLPASTVIPIQGTFDIARGRNTIRTQIASQHWPVSFNARAATAMTVLGELILLCNGSKAVPVHITVLSDHKPYGIEMFCTLPKPTGEIARWKSKMDNLARMADPLDVKEHGDQIDIRACICL